MTIQPMSKPAVVTTLALEVLWAAFTAWLTFGDKPGNVTGLPFRYDLLSWLHDLLSTTAIAIVVLVWFVDSVVGSRILRGAA